MTTKRNVMSPSEVGSATRVTSGPNAAILVKETTLSPAARRALTLDVRVIDGVPESSATPGRKPK